MCSRPIALEELLEYWPGVELEEPCPIGDGGSQASSTAKGFYHVAHFNCCVLSCEATFDAAKLALVDGMLEEYRCSNNLLKSDLYFNPDPNVPWLSRFAKKEPHLPSVLCQVPIRSHSIDRIAEYYYAEPSPLQEPYEVVVPKGWADEPKKVDHTKAKPVIPTEHLIAFILPPSLSIKASSTGPGGN